jgi:hypothetical protein
MPGASSRHITNLKQSIFCLSISMQVTLQSVTKIIALTFANLVTTKTAPVSTNRPQLQAIYRSENEVELKIFVC